MLHLIHFIACAMLIAYSYVTVCFADETNNNSFQPNGYPQRNDYSQKNNHSQNRYIPFYIPRLDLSVVSGRSISGTKSYGSLRFLLFPFEKWHKSQWLVDLRGHRFEDGKWASNLGVALRHPYLEKDDNFLMGYYLFYDYRKGRSNYSQLSGGVESLSPTWDFRFNCYFPIGQTRECNSKNCQFAMKGVDFEVGYHLGSWALMNFYVAGGSYWYSQAFRLFQAPGPLWGGKARAVLQWQDYVTVEASISHDSHFRTRVQWLVVLAFPWELFLRCKKNKSIQPARHLFLQPIKRQEIIVLD